MELINKPLTAEQKNLLAVDTTSVEEITGTFKEFNKELSKQLQELRELQSERVFIEDSSAGLKVELVSSRMSIRELTDLGASAFTFMKNQRQEKPAPLGV